LEKLSSLEFDIDNYSLNFVESEKENKKSVTDKVFLTEDEDSEDNTNVEIKQKIDDILNNANCADEEVTEKLCDKIEEKAPESLSEDVCLNILPSLDDFCELDDILHDDLLDISVNDSDESEHKNIHIIQEKCKENPKRGGKLNESIIEDKNNSSLSQIKEAAVDETIKKIQENKSTELGFNSSTNLVENKEKEPENCSSKMSNVQPLFYVKENEKFSEDRLLNPPIPQHEPKKSLPIFERKSMHLETSKMAIPSVKKIQRKIPIYRTFSVSNLTKTESMDFAKEENYCEFDGTSNNLELSQKDNDPTEQNDTLKTHKVQPKKSGCIVSKAETSKTRKFFQRKKFGSMNTKFTSRQLPASSLTFEDDDPFAIDNDIKREKAANKEIKRDEDSKRIKVSKKEQHLIKKSEELGKKATRSLLKLDNVETKKQLKETRHCDSDQEPRNTNQSEVLSAHVSDPHRSKSDKKEPNTDNTKGDDKIEPDEDKTNSKAHHIFYSDQELMMNHKVKTTGDDTEIGGSSNFESNSGTGMQAKPKGKRGRPKKRPLVSEIMKDDSSKILKLTCPIEENQKSIPLALNKSEDHQENKNALFKSKGVSNRSMQDESPGLELSIEKVKDQDGVNSTLTKKKRGRPKKISTDLNKKIKLDIDVTKYSLNKDRQEEMLQNKLSISDTAVDNEKNKDQIENKDENQKEEDVSLQIDMEKPKGQNKDENQKEDNFLQVDIEKQKGDEYNTVPLENSTPTCLNVSLTFNDEKEKESPKVNKTDNLNELNNKHCQPSYINKTQKGKKRGRPRKSFPDTVASPMQQNESFTQLESKQNDVKRQIEEHRNTNEINSKTVIGRKSKRSVDCNDQNQREDEKKVKPYDYERLIIDAVEQLNDNSGSDRKSVRKFLAEKNKKNIPLKLVGLCLESAAVAGRLKQVERKGASFYVLQETVVPSTSLDNSIVEDNAGNVKESRSEVNTSENGVESINKQEVIESLEEKQDPTCPVCFKMLLNSEKMKLHIRECHGSEDSKTLSETPDNSLKLTIHLSPQTSKIRVKCKTEEQ